MQTFDIEAATNAHNKSLNQSRNNVARSLRSVTFAPGLVSSNVMCVLLRVVRVMFNQSLIGMSVFAFVIPFASQPSQALAQIPMLWGSGEALSEVGELPDNVAAPVNGEFGANVSVGFLYQRFHIFWCDLWT